MKTFITFIFTAFLLLAFQQDVEAVDTKPAFPEWVESTNDPPDCIVEGVSKGNYIRVYTKTKSQNDISYESSNYSF